MRNFKLFGLVLTLLSGLIFFTGCQEETISPSDIASIDERNSALVGTSPNTGFYGLGPANELYFYYSGPPVTLFSSTVITGLRDGERIIAIDIRPSTGHLYGVSDSSNIYWIRTTLAMDSHTPIAQAFLVSTEPLKPALEGTMVGFDFESKPERIRIVTDTGQNLTVDPNTGLVIAVDTEVGVHGGNVMINGTALYTNPYSTVGNIIYDMDAAEGKLYKQYPGTPSLTLVGSTGLMITGEGGFDISTKGTAMAVLQTGKPGAVDPEFGLAYRLYSVNLKNAQVTVLGTVDPMIGMAIR